jgi:hypothetical protein
LPALAPRPDGLSCSALTMLPTLPDSLLARYHDGAIARPDVYRPGYLDLSAAEAKTAARSRAIVHVAFTFVRCPDGPRCEKSRLRENLWQHPRSPKSACLLPGSELVARGGTARRRCTLRFHAPLVDRAPLPQSPLRQGRPPNQERIFAYEERNADQRLPARGVPHRHC